MSTALVPTAATDVTVLPPIDAQIQRANELHDTARSSFARGCDMMIMCGLQLASIRAQCKHGEWELLFDGSEKRVKGKRPTAGNVPTVGHFNFSKSSAHRYMDLAEAVQKRFSKLKDLGDKDIMSMDESWQLEAIARIRAEIGPSHYTELAAELGLIKPPGLLGGDNTPRDADGKRITRSAQELAEAAIYLADERVKELAVTMLVLFEEPECRTLCLASPATRKILRDAMIDLRHKLDQIKEPK